MAKRQTLTVTLPDGTVHTRTSERPYTCVYALLIQYEGEDAHWVLQQWSLTEANARKSFTSITDYKAGTPRGKKSKWMISVSYKILEQRVIPVNQRTQE